MGGTVATCVALRHDDLRARPGRNWSIGRPERRLRLATIARATGLDDGFTSRIIQRLEHDRLVERTPEGTVRVRDANLLLDAWSEVYDFEKHTIVRGHISARDGEELLTKAADTLEGKTRYAATGLAAAYLYTRFATFRLATFFVDRRPPESLLKTLGFREEPRGANVWLVIPNDAGVFDAHVRATALTLVRFGVSPRTVATPTGIARWCTESSHLGLDGVHHRQMTVGLAWKRLLALLQAVATRMTPTKLTSACRSTVARSYAMAVYTKARATPNSKRSPRPTSTSPTRAITIAKQADRKSKGRKGTKATKTKRVRTVDIEPHMLRARGVARESTRKGRGSACSTCPRPRTAPSYSGATSAPWASSARRSTSSVTPLQRAIVFHDLRDTGLTHMAVRGDSPIAIQWAGGHTDFKTTQGYIARGQVEARRIGEPLPPLPPSAPGAPRISPRKRPGHWIPEFTYPNELGKLVELSFGDPNGN